METESTSSITYVVSSLRHNYSRSQSLLPPFIHWLPHFKRQLNLKKVRPPVWNCLTVSSIIVGDNEFREKVRKLKKVWLYRTRFLRRPLTVVLLTHSLSFSQTHSQTRSTPLSTRKTTISLPFLVPLTLTDVLILTESFRFLNEKLEGSPIHVSLRDH